ncbi:MAG: hypothetical protein BJ554DRAFT_5000, partial [Olpidium bornovanus]
MAVVSAGREGVRGKRPSLPPIPRRPLSPNPPTPRSPPRTPDKRPPEQTACSNQPKMPPVDKAHEEAGGPLPERIPGVPHARLVVVGSGPAGHTAAIYAARALLRPVLFEGEIDVVTGITPGGQLTSTTEVENFPGFPKGVTGPELCQLFKDQSEHHGTEIRDQTVVRVDLSSRPFKFWTTEDPTAKPDITADALIVATGATARRLHIPGEETLWQAGISACAVCDGAAPIFRNKELAVIGGGDTAVGEPAFVGLEGGGECGRVNRSTGGIPNLTAECNGH